MSEFKEYLEKLKNRTIFIENLFDASEISISFDRLKSEKLVDQDLLYFNLGDNERAGVFVFGFDFFVKELSEQEFKRRLGPNSSNFKIYKAYKDLVKSGNKKIKVSDLLNKIQDRRKDSKDVHDLLKNILTLAYYFEWDLEKDKKDLEGDYFIKIPERFLLKVKQRYNFDVLCAVYENSEIFVFVNGRGKLNLVFKDLCEFGRKDLNKVLTPMLKKVFGLKKVIYEES